MDNQNSVKVKIIKAGPLEVAGEVELFDNEGKRILTENTIYLCRCGGSSNKPFCDGTHRTTDFLKSEKE